MKIADRRRTILGLIGKHGVLNKYQMCRLMNKFGKNEFRPCYFSFKEKPKGSSNPGGVPCRSHKTCEIKVHHVAAALRGMKLRSEKRRGPDKGGIGSDLFRYYYTDPRELHRQVLNRTLIPYVKKRPIPQSTITEW